MLHAGVCCVVYPWVVYMHSIIIFDIIILCAMYLASLLCNGPVEWGRVGTIKDL